MPTMSSEPPHQHEGDSCQGGRGSHPQTQHQSQGTVRLGVAWVWSLTQLVDFRYYGICCLNQFVINKEDEALAGKLVDIYLTFFKVCGGGKERGPQIRLLYVMLSTCDLLGIAYCSTWIPLTNSNCFNGGISCVKHPTLLVATPTMKPRTHNTHMHTHAHTHTLFPIIAVRT